MTFRIEPMAVSDAERCAELEVILFPGDGPWSADAFRAELAAPHSHYAVARDDVGQLVGYAGIALLGNSMHPESEIHTIGTDPAYRRRGVGRALLDELLRKADTRGGPVYLEVRTDNDAAIALYRRVGFEIVGTRRKYYQPSGADAFTMRRSGSAEEPAQ
ncbi:ribosomal-protein-alanine N-acetyltransferase [Rhodococcus sp. WMMA185]|uniref:ribosomal protein S18-alanine N-acetyltransferase n=1 Tax=Rhodococcus sp. WMMA185 TaxID=679318 RepID=UPI0008790550|nr:ribosomal protein S18-alanine N-acetyltransferase [Rhodococcus sp. WMMA185]AOW92113.1 ribosomal-protein-alanine N-acetyltransferase [Rhodococcus sp. WMMA185]